MDGKLGFIGLASMGSRMAARLIEAAGTLAVYNRSPKIAAALADRGASPASSIGELVAKSQVILSSLSDEAAVRQVAGVVARYPNLDGLGKPKAISFISVPGLRRRV